jgi:hypothetical protein
VSNAAMAYAGLTIALAGNLAALAPTFRGHRPLWLLMAATDAFVGIIDTLDGTWPAAPAQFAIAAFCGWMWWRRSDRRRRALAWLGAKSRAVRDALVRKAREVSQPRPVLVPGGAR